MSYVNELLEKMKAPSITGYRINIIAGIGLCIEGHRGLYYVSTENIKVRVKHGSIEIKGEGLGISYISDSEIIVTGSIIGVEL